MKKILLGGLLLCLLATGYFFLHKDKPLAHMAQQVEEEQKQIVWDTEYNKYLKEPIDVAIWGRYLFITDIGKKAVVRLDVKTGKAQTLAPKELKFSYPYGLLVVEDVLYISDCANKTIQAYDLSAEAFMGVLYSGGDGTKPGFMAVDNNKNLWVSDLQFKRVLKLSREGMVLDSFGEGLLVHPQGITVLNGQVLVADEYQGCIYRIDLATEELGKFSEMPSKLSLIRDLASQDNLLYATKPLGGTLDVYDLTGRYLAEHNIATPEGSKGIPMGVTPLPQGGALVVDRANGCLQSVLP